MKKIKIVLLLSSLFLITMTGCKKLLVENLDNPDFDKVFASGDDLENVTSSLFNTWYYGNHSYDGTNMFLATSSDNVTCSWGNQSMRDMSWEPRNAWNNAPNYSYQATTKYLFDKMYASINTASNVIKAINSGVEVGSGGARNNLVKAFCKFNQGIAYGSLALVFDKAFIVDENITIPGATVADGSSYKDVALKAVSYLNEAITLSAGGFTVPKGWLGTAADYSSADFVKLCNSMAARILANYPRTKAEAATVNWGTVKTHADAGITTDFTIVNDGYVKWYAEAGDYLTFPGWGKVDMFVVNLMDNSQPQHWGVVDRPNPPESTNPQDQRIFTDFEYSSLQWLQATRGYYHYSNYRYKRYDDQYALGDGPIPDLMKAENDMYRAEARAYTSDVAGAAAIINAGTRTTRGQMTPVAATLAAVEQAILHERQVEMYVTGMGLQHFAMRKLNLLQKGTLLHWPLPAKTLETFRETLPFYTYGGGSGDGINSSNVGWR
jgi:hypothetical protein